MAWRSLSIETDCVHAEALADALLEHGALAVSIEDADAGTPAEKPQYGEPGSLAQPGWERSLLQVLTSQELDVETLLSAAARQAGLAERPPFSEEKLAEHDWVQLTQSQFDPIRVSDRLWIVPSWHQPPDPQAVTLVLDPGMAFGTGSHPTTRLCLEWLERRVRTGTSLLDYGCGSGILAIAAALLGAREVVGVDIDEMAVNAARSNAARNGASCTHFRDATQELTGQFDLVVANILANPLKVLAPAICGYVRHGGELALAGVLSAQAADVIAAYAPYIALQAVATREGWVCLAGIKH